MVKSWRDFSGAIYIAIAAAFLLGGYEFIRSPTNTLFKHAYGKEHLPVLMALIPFSVFVGLYIYGRILTKLGPRKTLIVTSLGSGVLMMVGQQLYVWGFKSAIIFLYQLREIYVVLLIEQYWSYLNSSMDESIARRLNGPVCGIASLGAIVAGTFGMAYTDSLGTHNMMIFAALSVLPASFFADMAFKQGKNVKQESQSREAKHGHLALSLFKSERVLLLILIMIVMTQVLSASANLVYEGILQDRMPDPDMQTAFSFGVFRTINIGAALLQFLVAPMVLAWTRLSIVHILIPIIHIGTSIWFIAEPSLSAASSVYCVFKMIDYSVFRAAKEILYIPLSFDARYRVKEVIDVFGYRFSKGGTALLITILQKVGLVFSEIVYAAIGLGAAVIWLMTSVPLLRHYRKNTTRQDRNGVFERSACWLICVLGVACLTTDLRASESKLYIETNAGTLEVDLVVKDNTPHIAVLSEMVAKKMFQGQKLEPATSHGIVESRGHKDQPLTCFERESSPALQQAEYLVSLAPADHRYSHSRLAFHLNKRKELTKRYAVIGSLRKGITLLENRIKQDTNLVIKDVKIKLKEGILLNSKKPALLIQPSESMLLAKSDQLLRVLNKNIGAALDFQGDVKIKTNGVRILCDKGQIDGVATWKDQRARFLVYGTYEDEGGFITSQVQFTKF